jgi:hypothetical protein
MKARWIRIGRVNPIEFETLTTHLALAQGSESQPVLAWGEDEMHYHFALIAPRRLAPGRSSRWGAWGLAPAVAAYRQFGVGAYFEQEGIWLHGRCIGEARVQAIGACALIAATFLATFPANCIITPSALIEDALRRRLEAQHGWQFDHSWPSALERLERIVA